MKSLFEDMGGTYRREGDYQLPNLELPVQKAGRPTKVAVYIKALFIIKFLRRIISENLRWLFIPCWEKHLIRGDGGAIFYLHRKRWFKDNMKIY